MKNKRNLTSLIIIFFIFILVSTGCSLGQQEANKENSKKIKPTSKNSFIMGTLVKITIYDQLKNEEVFNKAFQRVQEIEDKMTINKLTDKSEIIKLNNAAGKKFVDLSPETFLVLEKGKYYSSLAKGKFDITIGPIVKLWNIDTENAHVPEHQLIKNKLPLVNFQNLLLAKDKKQAKLLKENMIVDLGAIAKGYAADEVAKVLRETGINHAIINLGGNILTLNAKPDGSPWRLGLQNPYKPRGDYMGIVKLKNQALVSSGTYEKYFEANGKRYHHILDPQTGYPAENNLISVSIITEKSLDADALSTTIFLLGLDKGMDLVEHLDNVEAIFITYDKKVYTSSGINKNVFEIVNAEYQLVK